MAREEGKGVSEEVVELYTCAMCLQEFGKQRSDQEAAAEANINFTPQQLAGELDIVCDQCFKEMAARYGWKNLDEEQ
jgi:hypothetical protein